MKNKESLISELYGAFDGYDESYLADLETIGISNIVQKCKNISDVIDYLSTLENTEELIDILEIKMK